MLITLVGLTFIVLFVSAIVSIWNGAPFVVTSKETIANIIKISSVKKGDKVIDLGSGDGRVLLAFASKGAEVYGCETNPILVLISRLRLRVAGQTKNSHIMLKSLWKEDLGKYDIIYVFGIKHIMPSLEKKIISEAKPSTKIISQSYKFPNMRYSRCLEGVYLYIKK
jgi:16S rRNA A1518/A1519 N6-dimethyltransferase RsmA/KsgA/DIM1 with predicted DNA glycosylase/AP lyase activity